MPINDLYGGFFDDPDLNPEGPRQAFFGRQNLWTTPNMRDYFRNQFSAIQNQYMGQLGQQVLGGGAPSLGFNEFLSRFPWQQRFQELSPRERGQDASRFNPFTKWLV